jgi:hypothetical protein
MTSGQLNISRECTPVVDARYEAGSEQTPATAVVEAVARAEGVDATELPPLYDDVDMDALNRLFDGGKSVTGPGTVLTFQVDNWNVFVNTDGRIRVCDATRPTEPAPVFQGSCD